MILVAWVKMVGEVGEVGVVYGMVHLKGLELAEAYDIHTVGNGRSDLRTMERDVLKMSVSQITQIEPTLHEPLLHLWHKVS